MGKVPEKWNHICAKAVCLFILAVMAAFICWAAVYTHQYMLDMPSELISGYYDNIAGNFLFAAAAAAAGFLGTRLLLRGPAERQEKIVRYIMAGTLLLYGILLTVWVSVSHSFPMADQQQLIIVARDFMKRDYQQMDTYMDLYPQQYGMVFFLELLLRIWDDERFLQYLNVLWILLIVWFSCGIAQELFHSLRVKLYCLFANVLFLPLFFYVNFVYGDIPSIALGLVLIWCVLKWTRGGGRWYYAGGALACAVLAALVRMNTMVLLLAVAIALVLYAWANRRAGLVLFAVLLLALPVAGQMAVKSVYEIRSGKEIGDGVPAVLWIAMGMQESWDGAGVYNGFNNSTYVMEADRDSKTAAKIGFDFIRGRVKEFLENPSMARLFYRDKIQGEWNEPTFGCFIMTKQLGEDSAAIVRESYYGELYKKIKNYMDDDLFFLYVAFFVWALSTLFHRQDDMCFYMAAIAFIGGFLFSVLWEAKSRYVLPYMIFALPYCACGMELLPRWILAGLGAGWGKLRAVFDKRDGKG